MRKQRQYTEQQKGAALAWIGAGQSINATAKEFGIPFSTVKAWVDGRQGINDDIRENVLTIKENMADKIEGLIDKMLDSVPEKIPAGSLAATWTSIGIGVEKMRLLREQSTVNTVVMTVEEREAAAEDLLKTVYLRVVESRRSA